MASLKLSPFWMWVIALLVAMSGLVFQRLTAPFYPEVLEETWGGATVRTQLERGASGRRGQRIVVEGTREDWQGEILWRSLELGGDYRHEPMTPTAGYMIGTLPLQPLGSRIEYRVRLLDGADTLSLPRFGTVVLRFKGEVSFWAITGHLLLVHLGLLFGVRAGLEALALGPHSRSYALATLFAFGLGGLLFGVMVKSSAYGIPWQGPPLGLDATDSKTLLVVLAWCLPPLMRLSGRRTRRWIVLAMLLSVAAFFIPHTILGGR